MKYRTLFALLWLLFSGMLYAQSSSPDLKKFPSKSNARSIYSRWTFSPLLFPYIPLVSQQKDSDDQIIDTNYDQGLLAGIRVEKYFPNAPIGWGAEVSVFNRDLFLFQQSHYFISESAVSLTPVWKFKTGNFEKLNHGFIELGIRGQYSFIQEFLSDDGFFERESDIIKDFRLWAYLGVGKLKDVFNQDSRRAGLTTFSVGAYFGLFDQDNTFKRKASDFSTSTEARFANNETANIFLTAQYSQLLDFRKNNASNYTIPADLVSKSQSKFLPPLLNWNNPRTNFFGNFYLSAGVQPRIDSINLAYDAPEVLDLVNLSHGLSTHLGYSFHFGNYAQSYLKDGSETLNQHVSGIRFDFFGSGGFYSQRLVLGKNTRYRINNYGAEATGGIRVGYVPTGIFVLGGITRIFPLRTDLRVGGELYPSFELADTRSRNIVFLGLSWKNAIVFKVNYQETPTQAEVSSLGDNLWFSVGFGI